MRDAQGGVLRVPQYIDPLSKPVSRTRVKGAWLPRHCSCSTKHRINGKIPRLIHTYGEKNQRQLQAISP